MFRILAAAAALSIAAAPAVAQDASADRPQIASPAPAGGSAPAAAAKKETRYCVDQALTGTRMPKRVCRTRGEWRAEGFDPTAK